MCHTGIQCRAAEVKHPGHGVGVVMSNEASNHKVALFPQLSWRDEVIMLKKEVGGTKQPSFHSLLNPRLPHLLQVNHVLLLSLFCLMWDADRLGKALTCGTSSYRVHVTHWNTVPSSRGEAPQSWRRRSNEQWGIKSQSCTFPTVKLEGQSNNAKKRSWTDEATIISLVAESASPSSSSS